MRVGIGQHGLTMPEPDLVQPHARTHQRLALSQDSEGWKRGRYALRLLASDGPLSTVAAHVREGRFEALAGVMGTQRTKLDIAQKTGMTAGELMSTLFPERG